MSAGAASMVQPARVALSELIVEAAKPPPGAQDEWVDHYDAEAFSAGVPSVAPRGEIRADAQAVEPDDVLVSRIVDVPRRAWVVSANRGRPQLASHDWLVLRAAGFDPAYLRHLLVSNDFHVRFTRAVAAGMRLARASAVGAIDIPAPPLHEQNRIGQVLGMADGLRAKRNAVAARLDALPGAVFREQIGDSSRTLWPLARLADLLIDAPVRDDLVAASDRREWLVVRAANITRGGLDLARCEHTAADAQAIRGRAIVDGDVLVALGNDALGPRAAVAHPAHARWLAHAQVLKLRFDPTSVRPEYVRALFASHAGRAWLAPLWQHCRRRSRIEAPDLADIELPLPPIAMQEKLIAMLFAARALNGKVHQSARRLDALLAALRDAAFRGELHPG